MTAAEYASERIFKIGQHVAKLQFTKRGGLIFMAHLI